MAFPKKPARDKARRVQVTLAPRVLKALDSIAKQDAPRGAEANRSAVIARLIEAEHAARERAKADERTT